MRIHVLLENTTDRDDIKTEHGLSLYIETETHRILFDMGVSQAYAENAETMGIDLTETDIAVVSHGHGDHGGGLSNFLHQNRTAPVYLQKTAFCPLYYRKPDDDNENLSVIGLNPALGSHPQLNLIEGDHTIEEGLEILTGVDHCSPLPGANEGLLMGKEGVLLPDDFIHEQNLLIRENGKSLLLTGCSHHGIVNIVNDYHQRYGDFPDVVIGGFHLILSKDFDERTQKETEDVGAYLRKTPTTYYTGHCTGKAPFEALRDMLGDQVHHFRAGQQITV